jgi:hypothetical protein
MACMGIRLILIQAFEAVIHCSVFYLAIIFAATDSAADASATSSVYEEQLIRMVSESHPLFQVLETSRIKSSEFYQMRLFQNAQSDSFWNNLLPLEKIA